MKYLLLYIALFLLIFPNPSFAHVGVQKRSGNTIVTFYQTPLSPLVGEEVKITFVVTDIDLKPRRSLKGILTLIDTFYGDESKDKKILDKRFETDANGAFKFSYTFEKENFFNINLQFDGQEERWQRIDYLIQPRKTGTIITRIKDISIFVVIISGLVGISGWILGLKLFISYNSAKNNGAVKNQK